MLTAAIWGSGFIANTHVDALRRNGITVAAVVSRTAERARAFAEKWGIPQYSEDLAILFQDGIDCVHVCTPPNMHFEMVMELLRHNKHVVCEKPLCLEDRQAKQLAALAREKSLVCAVNFNVRYHDACQKAKQLVEAPDFGRVLLIHGNYLQEFSALPAGKDWRFDPQLAGKMHAVTEIGSHWLDLAQYISGLGIAAVSAQFDHFYPVRWVEDGVMYAEPAEGREPFSVYSEDAAIINLRFKNGAIGTVVLSEISQGRVNHLSLEITGEKTSLWWNSENQNLLCFAQKGGVVNSNVFVFGTGFADTFRKLIADVYSDIATKQHSERRVYPTFDDGMRSVLLCNAIFESANHNSAWISVDEEKECV